MSFSRDILPGKEPIWLICDTVWDNPFHYFLICFLRRSPVVSDTIACDMTTRVPIVLNGGKKVHWPFLNLFRHSGKYYRPMCGQPMMVTRRRKAMTKSFSVIRGCLLLPYTGWHMYFLNKMYPYSPG